MKNQMKHFFLIAVFLLTANLLFACSKTRYTRQDKALFRKYCTYIAPFRSKSIQIVIEKTATFFIGTPYVGHTLDVSMNEELVVNLRQLDCVTFVENVLALSRTAKSDSLLFCCFIKELQAIRYRNGVINGYESRLHYTSDWIFENQKQGFVKNISVQLGGKKETKKINFMSTHPEAYKQLKSNDTIRKKIIAIETRINNRSGFYFVPTQKIESIATSIPHLAVIAFTTSIKGLDTTHIGFAYRKKNGVLSFIHASSRVQEVIIDNQSLYDYCASQKSCTGIMVAKVER